MATKDQGTQQNVGRAVPIERHHQEKSRKTGEKKQIKNALKYAEANRCISLLCAFSRQLVCPRQF
jgi:hypothetical protein